MGKSLRSTASRSAFSRDVCKKKKIRARRECSHLLAHDPLDLPFSVPLLNYWNSLYFAVVTASTVNDDHNRLVPMCHHAYAHVYTRVYAHVYAQTSSQGALYRRMQWPG